MIDQTVTPAVVDSLICQKQSFALYRIPGQKRSRLLTMDSGSICTFGNLRELNGQRGFVIAPFHIHETCPIVLIRPSGSAIPRWVEPEDESAVSEDQPDEEELIAAHDDGSYQSRFDVFIEALRAGTFDKLVLSRQAVSNKTEGFSPSTIFRAACKRYLHSYIYLCYTPQTGLWLGCTPEIILSGVKNNWSTVALAGTQPLLNGQLPTEWDDKNRREQEYVAAYIRQRLLALGIKAQESGPYSAYAGALSHLKTDFRFTLDSNGRLGDLLNILHPTPAVCGVPKEEAYRFILDNEGYDRAYYSGFVGWMDPDGETDLYVNLRCMHIADRELTFYAGGGLLASSDGEDEWQETEKKMQTMKRIVASDTE